MAEALASASKKIASPLWVECVTVARLVLQSQSKFKILNGSVTISGTQKCHQRPARQSFLSLNLDLVMQIS
jgi:hypothetical protein